MLTFPFIACKTAPMAKAAAHRIHFNIADNFSNLSVMQFLKKYPAQKNATAKKATSKCQYKGPKYQNAE